MEAGVEVDDTENWNEAFYDETDAVTQNTTPCNTVQYAQAEVSREGSSKQANLPCTNTTHPRVIIHIDIDCFYAQVEMLRNPSLRDKPLGIQQKYLMVTCNYVARAQGVKKCCSVQEALRACPHLVLVNGEDLTNYREMSYKITELMLRYTSQVERLGFDENFLDVTDLVMSPRWCQLANNTSVIGHVYEADTESPDVSNSCTCGCHARLDIGSHIAADIRQTVHKDLGITCCAGVGHNKLLSKLVTGTHKPNQQTLVYPEKADLLVLNLGNVKKIPGIGLSMAGRLEVLKISSIQELRDSRYTDLVQEFGQSLADWLRQVAVGNDTHSVTPTKPPQSMSDEDSFKCCNTLVDAKMKIDSLLQSLLIRLLADGRNPQVLRVTVRKAIGEDRKRESRQCPIPNSVLRHFNQGTLETTGQALQALAEKLFTRAVDVTQPFHLTVINVCFTKFPEEIQSPKGIRPIEKFFHKATENVLPSQSINNVKDSLSDQPSKKKSPCNKRTETSIQSFFTSYQKKSNESEISTVLDKYREGHMQGPKSVREKNEPEIGKMTGYFARSSHKRRLSPAELCTSDVESDLNMITENRGKTWSSPRMDEVSAHSQHQNDIINPLKRACHCVKSGNKLESDSDTIQGRDASLVEEDKTLSPFDTIERTVQQTECPVSPHSQENLPANIDPDVFKQLPKHIQLDILAEHNITGPKPDQSVGQTIPQNCRGQCVNLVGDTQQGGAGMCTSVNGNPGDKLVYNDDAIVAGTSRSAVSGLIKVTDEHTEISEVKVFCSNTGNKKNLLDKECAQRNSCENVSDPVQQEYQGYSEPATSRHVRGINGNPVECESLECPPDIDLDIFTQLPVDIKQELWQQWKLKQKTEHKQQNILQKTCINKGIMKYFNQQNKN